MVAAAYLTCDVESRAGRRADGLDERGGVYVVKDARTGRVERVPLHRPDIARHILAHGVPKLASPTGLTLSAINVIGDAIGEALRQREAPHRLTLTAADVNVIAAALTQRDARILALEARAPRPMNRTAAALARATASQAAADRVLLGYQSASYSPRDKNSPRTTP